MVSIQRCELPEVALLRKYLVDGAYADCYATDTAKPVTHAAYVEAFYTTEVFKLERLILALLASKPSTDAQANQLASGSLDVFAAWRVEGRAADQILLADYTGRTRSWLMVAPSADARPGTRLYFGSAVVPAKSTRTGNTGLGLTFRALLGFHKVYSRVLLYAARSRLAR